MEVLRQYMKKISKVFVFLLLIAMQVTSISGQENHLSQWAESSVVALQNSDLFRENIFDNYQEPITRQEFIYLAVRIYEIIQGEDIELDPSVTFKDTDDIYVLKGAKIGITEGTGNGNFSPELELTREQLAVLMVNALKLAGEELKPVSNYTFVDESSFSSWAKESIYIAKANGIIEGIGHDTFDNKGSATIEAALKITYSILENNANFVSGLKVNRPVCDSFEDSLIHVGYEVSIHDFNEGKAYIKMYLDNISLSAINIKNHGYHGYYSGITDFNVYDNEGNSVNTNYKGVYDIGFETEGKEWVIYPNGATSLIIEYEVDKQILYDNQYKGYIGNGFGLFTGEQLIGLYLGDEQVWHEEIYVVFDVPKGSTVTVPWESEKGVYYPNQGFYGENMPGLVGKEDNMMQSTIAIGDFVKIGAMVGETAVSVAVPTQWERTRQLETAEDVFLLIDYYNNLFETSIGNHYMVAYSDETHTGNMIWAGEWSLSQGTAAQGNDYKLTMIAHQMFHRWNGWTWGWDTDREVMADLLMEGNNRYYEGKSSATLIEELHHMSNNDITYLETIYKQYLDRYESKDIVAYADSKSTSSNDTLTWTSYNFGALIWLGLEIELYEDTNGKVSVDDIMAAINKEYGNYNGYMKYEDLLRIMKDLSGKDYSSFFNKYVFGTDFLDLSSAFEDVDQDGIPYYYEIFLGEGSDLGALERLKESVYTKNTLVIGSRTPCETFASTYGIGVNLTGNPTSDLLENASCVVLLNNGHYSLDASGYGVFKELNTSAKEEWSSKVWDGILYIYIESWSDARIVNMFEEISFEELMKTD